MARATPFSRLTLEALTVLGGRIEVARKERRWTRHDVADRVGVSVTTVGKIERGDAGVRIGTAFEVAAVMGVPLFHEDESRLSDERRRVGERLAVLPRRVRRPVIDDDF